MGVAGAKGLAGAALHTFLAGLNPVLLAARRVIHHGIDIIAPDNTPVYALTKRHGPVRRLGQLLALRPHRGLRVRAPREPGPGRVGARVTAFSTVIGRVFPGQDHVPRACLRGRSKRPVLDGLHTDPRRRPTVTRQRPTASVVWARSGPGRRLYLSPNSRHAHHCTLAIWPASLEASSRRWLVQKSDAGRNLEGPTA